MIVPFGYPYRQENSFLKIKTSIYFIPFRLVKFFYKITNNYLCILDLVIFINT